MSFAKGRTGLNPTAYRGVEASTPPQFVAELRAPTVKDYKDYNIGTIWLDLSPTRFSPPEPPDGDNIWMLVSKINKQGEWVRMGAGGILHLTGDTGGEVDLDSNDNINVLGTVGRIITTGNPGTNTITWDVGETIPITIQADSGSAVAQNNILNIVGGTGIDTEGVADQITINVGSDVATQYTTDAGIAIPSGNNLNVVGGSHMNTAGAGDTLTINLDGDVATTYTADVGSATPAANNLNVFGGTGIQVSGAGDTLTVTSTAVSASSSFTANAGNIPNVTGAGATYTILFSTVLYNLGGDFDTGTGLYTAPSDGLYTFNSTVTMGNLTSSMLSWVLYFVVSGTGPCVGQWSFTRNRCYDLRDSILNSLRVNGGISLLLDAGDTIGVQTQISGGAGNTARVDQGVPGPGEPTRTFFAGYLVRTV